MQLAVGDNAPGASSEESPGISEFAGAHMGASAELAQLALGRAPGNADSNGSGRAPRHVHHQEAPRCRQALLRMSMAGPGGLQWAALIEVGANG